MRWGRIGVLALTGLIGLSGGLIVAQPWDGPTAVSALELDEARRDDDAADGEVRDDDDADDDKTGSGTGNGGGRNGGAAPPTTDVTAPAKATPAAATGTGTGAGNSGAAATDDGRDGTREGDTSHGQGTGTGNSQRRWGQQLRWRRAKQLRLAEGPQLRWR